MSWSLTLVTFTVAWLAALAAPRALWRRARRCGDALVGRRHRRAAAQRGAGAGSLRAAIVVFLFALALGVLPRAFRPFPPPWVQDEFAYLLAADTFSHGRLTNPTHPLWRNFETIHELMRPTYQAKFLPGQGLALAAGQLLGSPSIGAFGMVALGCAAIAWALGAWLPARWAMLGGVLAACHPQLHYWGQSYWGGGVPLLGGALLTGAAARVLRSIASGRAGDRRDRSFRNGLIAGIGVGILGCSRPFEGAVVVVAAALVLSIASIRSRHARLIQRGPIARGLLARWIAGAACVVLPMVGWLGYYNYRVTGDATTLPYTLYTRQYMVAPLFWWQRPNLAQTYDHDKMRQFHVDDEYGVEYLPQTTPRGFVRSLGTKLAELGRQWFDAPTLAIPVLIGAGVTLRLRRRKTWRGRPALASQDQPLARRTRGHPALATGGRCLPRAAFARLALLIVLALPLANLALTPWLRMQYMAPACAAFFGLITLGLYEICGWRGRPAFGRRARAGRTTRVGAATVFAIVACQCVSLGTFIAENASTARPPGSLRRELVDLLSSTPGDHLVVVRYGAGKQSIDEWVFNAADIHNARIVFARIDRPDALRELMAYYPTRRVWLLDVDGPTVSPPRELRRP